MKRFDLITEAEARRLEPGSTVELVPGGHITPLAWDTLRAKRITVVSAGSSDPFLPPDVAPVTPVRRVAIGADHTGVQLKAALVSHLRRAGVEVTDLGTDGPEPVDYPDIAAPVARAVARREADAGIVIDGSGIGSAVAANKIRGVRAAVAVDESMARYAREHNGANVLALGAHRLTAPEACAIADTFLTTPMREPRYIRRLLKIRQLEEQG